MNENLCGLVLIDKPSNMTSTSVVRQIKKILQVSKVGHLGTLDPFATGLLPIMVGGATRLSEELMDLDKQYTFTIQLGVETDTLDSTGQIISKKKVPSEVDFEKIQNVLHHKFLGEIFQVPPVYSALKMDGRPLYEYMRASGKLPYDIQTKQRKVNVHDIKLLSFDRENNSIEICVNCTKGTYIRSLARDIAHSLDTVGMCSKLRRDKIGHFSTQKNCIQLSQKLNDDYFKNQLLVEILGPEKILNNIITIEFPQKFFNKLNTGNVFFVLKDDDLMIFEKINKYLGSNLKAKFFSKIIQKTAPLFLATAEQKDFDKIIIRPKKRII